MKRFYCKLCKKMIRVRKYPVMMDTSPERENPTDRIGVCNWHAESKSQQSRYSFQMTAGRK